jgi:putative transport protein
LDTLGLAGFMAALGLNDALGFVEGLRRAGPMLPLVGAVLAIIPMLAAILVGRFVFKMNAAMLVGACAGVATSNAALRAVQDAAKSPVPVLAYTVPYALGSILVTAFGPVIVLLMR